ncbi:polymorphic toxin-type HINT domain-containing protein [Streptomyces sp. AM 3-1-1]|uniref:polymorphic toxin-type HINT domain-containing protein n=1 Tax=Streptomyces sp. AM 3-1-1 TaxID=3028711 RepID=UPI0023B99E30|nr:polymorphic toxin-type HINT domain-containing protein [Streptomyces sp. AM 3-1-1]WEH27490.1 polymorphic toxin-type HINT domain-containing protein [Streptomyces sp. AM 3-1-1]
MKPRKVRHARVLRRRLSLLVSGALAAGLIQAAASPVQAAADSVPQQVSTDHPVKGEHGSAAEPRAKDKIPAHPKAPRHTWPKAGRHTVKVDATGGTGTKHLKRAGTSPISLAPVATAKTATRKAAKADTTTTAAEGAVETEVVSQARTEKAGVKGLLFTLVPQQAQTESTDKAGAVSVGVDYSSFAGAYGGSYASRLHLVSYPACVLTSPEKDACRRTTPVETRNDTTTKSLTASAVALSAAAPTVLAAEADDKGEKGDYKATSLSDAASWNTNLNSGDFSWSYDFTTPDVPGGLAPSLNLGYSSGSIDGRTSNTNNQSSWVGDGFDLTTGSIERRYKPCADDGEKKNADGNRPGDLCWDYDNAFLSFNGKGGELVPTGTDSFKLQQDDGTRIDRLRDTARGNGDADGEYWRVTTPDGTRYYYGYNRLPGYASGNEATNSVWTVPVFGNNTGEPCHKDDFASSYCEQGWRWNLDYVVDTHGNAMTYHYTKESNSYGRNLKAEDDTTYTRGGYLDRIDYGLKSDKIYGVKPLAQVVLSNAERCLPESGVSCEASTIKDKSAYWYDTPWDLNCDAGSKCDEGRLSPSFWTRKRLTGITTQVLKADGTYGKVDSWALNHKWGMADTDYQLLLDSIQHTGQAASPAITLPKTTFAYTQLANRLDKTGDGYAPFIKSRLSTIDGETGSQVDVAYSEPACDASALPKPETNTTRCYPVYLNQDPDATTTEVQWFNKYVTTQVTASDRTGGAADMITRYEYMGPAAWHYNDSDGLTRKKYRTWDQWRGYGQTRVLTGGSDGMKSQQDTYFLRGMDGDRKDTTGGTKSVSVSLGSGEGDPITDLAPYAGVSYKTETYNGPGGKILAKMVSRPWRHETAKRTREWGTVTANFSGTSESTDWTSLDDGAGAKWRTTKTETTYDTTAGRPVQVNNLGDTGTSADDTCLRSTYADNGSANLLTLPSRVENLAKACTATIDRAKDVVSDVRTAYDGGAYGTAPTKGDATRTATLKSYVGTKATYREVEATYDGYGRVLTAKDLSADVTVDGDAAPVRSARTDGRTATTTYTPATGFPTSVKTITPPAKAGVASSSLTTSQTLETLRGLPVKATDANGNDTVTSYDALGRVSKVWLADRQTTDLPSYDYTYRIEEGAPTAVGTRTIGNNDAQTRYSYTLYDGMLRARQTQTPGPKGGTLVADTFYDARGLVEKTFAPYYTTGGPSTSLFLPDDALSVQSQTRTVYDGLGRATQAQQIAGNGDGGAVLNTTKTIYGGDRTTVIPPQGATATTTVTDARGRTTELRQLHSHDTDTDAAADVTRYTYDARGQLATATDPAGNKWTYTYDQMGRQVETTDPDKGKTVTAYDDRDQVDHTTDAKGVSLYSVYDGMGRKTQLREGSTSGTLRAEWTYDSAIGGKGLPASSTRYDNGQAYKSQVSYYDDLGRAMKSSVTIPSTEGALGKTYNSSTTYLRSGLVSGASTSAAGGLTGGSVSYSYDDDTLWPTRVSADGQIAGLTTYTNDGKPDVITVAPEGSSKTTQVKNSYEWGTQRLSEQVVSRQDQPGIDRDAAYHYDEAGNITSVADTSRTGTDNQCYIYDYLGRMTEAWAQGTTTCSGSPVTAALGGPAPYWQTFTYDVTGNRTTQIQHDLTGKNNTKTTYIYPAAGGAHPHALSQAMTTGPTGQRLDEYHYDELGNTDKRPGQTLSWDAEGHLASVTEDNGDKTSYLYDADGNRLIARTPTETTLYLGGTEVTLKKGATKAEATRYTDLGSGITAVLADNGKYSYTIPDHQGTGQLAVDADTLAIQQRRTTPFGQPRGTTPDNWPGTKGFVGGTDDTESTGLQHLGAREYDPQTGRFISVDPIMDLTDPQQINGYTYSNNSPVTHSDASGQWIDDGTGHSEPHPKATGKKPKNVGVPRGGTGRGGCYYQCGFATVETDGLEGVRRDENRAVQQQVYASVTRFAESPEQARSWMDAFYVDMQRQYRQGSGIVDWNNILATAANVCYVHAGIECSERLKNYSEDVDLARTLSLGPEGDRAGGGLAATAFKEIVKDARSPLGRALKGCNVHSFLPETGVRLADGSEKPLDQIVLGDMVLATDPETGETKQRKVIAVIVTEDDKEFTDLSVHGDKGDSVLTATDTHPFWSLNRDAWIDAGDLRAGDLLRNTTGDTVRIDAVSHYVKRQRTYDLTVDRTHTYYVLAGQTPVLVHNSGAGPDPTSFSNLIPSDTPEWFKPIAPGTVLSRSGNYAYVVTGDGELVIGKRTAGHVSLAHGRDVLAAGEFKTKGGQVVFLDNKSGHYQPYGANAQKAAVDAFERNGLGAGGKYIEAWRPSC